MTTNKSLTLNKSTVLLKANCNVIVHPYQCYPPSDCYRLCFSLIVLRNLTPEEKKQRSATNAKVATGGLGECSAVVVEKLDS